MEDGGESLPYSLSLASRQTWPAGTSVAASEGHRGQGSLCGAASLEHDREPCRGERPPLAAWLYPQTTTQPAPAASSKTRGPRPPAPRPHPPASRRRRSVPSPLQRRLAPPARWERGAPQGPSARAWRRRRDACPSPGRTRCTPLWPAHAGTCAWPGVASRVQCGPSLSAPSGCSLPIRCAHAVLALCSRCAAALTQVDGVGAESIRMAAEHNAFDPRQALGRHTCLGVPPAATRPSHRQITATRLPCMSLL